MRRRVVLLVLGPVLAAAGCGGSASGGDTPDLASARKDLAGAPAPLAALHRQASRMLPGGEPAVQARLRALRGHPVVVNKWASWCAPCRFEFPVFQRVSVRLGRRVAFLGLNFRDSRSGARAFLRENPLSYPSYADPGGGISQTLRTGEGAPVTNFYDARGRLVFQHAGPYQRDAQLERDVRRYLGRA